jgi:hypothetical protein
MRDRGRAVALLTTKAKMEGGGMPTTSSPQEEMPLPRRRCWLPVTAHKVKLLAKTRTTVRTMWMMAGGMPVHAGGGGEGGGKCSQHGRVMKGQHWHNNIITFLVRGGRKLARSRALLLCLTLTSCLR